MTDPVADLIATAQPRTEKVRICARGDLVAAHAEAVAALAAAADGDSLAGDDVRAAAEAVKAIEDEQEAATVTFTLTAVSREKWADLLATHPPSKEERRAGHDHNPRTFPPAAVAACITDPPTTEEQAQTLASTVLPAGEFNKLFVAALTLNVTGTPAPKLAAATELLRVNGQSSTTPVPAASLEDDSLAGSGEQ